jgi:Septum formation
VTDERRGSPTSDDLVRAAREQTHGERTSIEEFTPVSPADTYRLGTGPDRGLAPDIVDEPVLTAEEIAAALAAATDATGPENPSREAPPRTPDESTAPTSEGPPVEDRGAWAPGPPDRSSVAFDVPDVGDDAPPSFTGDRWSTSSPEWDAYVAQHPARKRGLGLPRLPGLRTIVALAVFGFFGLGLIGSWLDGKQSVEDLDVGACFTVGEAEDVYDVPVVDCTEPHDSELYALVPIDGFGASHPGDDRLFDWLFDRCLERFPAYVGEPYESSDYWIDMLIPTADGWSRGDRVGMCTTITVDEDLNIRTSTGSAHNAGTEA